MDQKLLDKIRLTLERNKQWKWIGPGTILGGKAGEYPGLKIFMEFVMERKKANKEALSSPSPDNINCRAFIVYLLDKAEKETNGDKKNKYLKMAAHSKAMLEHQADGVMNDEVLTTFADIFFTLGLENNGNIAAIIGLFNDAIERSRSGAEAQREEFEVALPEFAMENVDLEDLKKWQSRSETEAQRDFDNSYYGLGVSTGARYIKTTDSEESKIELNKQSKKSLSAEVQERETLIFPALPTDEQSRGKQSLKPAEAQKKEPKDIDQPLTTEEQGLEPTDASQSLEPTTAQPSLKSTESQLSLKSTESQIPNIKGKGKTELLSAKIEPTGQMPKGEAKEREAIKEAMSSGGEGRMFRIAPDERKKSSKRKITKKPPEKEGKGPTQRIREQGAGRKSMSAPTKTPAMPRKGKDPIKRFLAGSAKVGAGAAAAGGGVIMMGGGEEATKSVASIIIATIHFLF